MAEENKFLKNLNKRIIVPSERITNCQDGVVELDQKTAMFGDYLEQMKQTGVARYSRKTN